MKTVLRVVLLIALALAVHSVDVQDLTAYNYHQAVGIHEAARIKETEDQYARDCNRIVGRQAAGMGNFGYQAGLLIDTSLGHSVCGAVLVSNTKLLTAAHCWFDGVTQSISFTVVLGTHLLFSGGTRIIAADVEMHKYWTPSIVANDIAMITILEVPYSSTIWNIILPTTAIDEDFAGSLAVASGFGKTSDLDGITINQGESFVWLNVITNQMCQQFFGEFVLPSHICTSGFGGVGTCGGDSGGPLAIDHFGQAILIGVTSFGSSLGCQENQPSVYTRVTFYLPWIQERL